MATSKKRIFYIDEIRALAIIFVLVIHVSKWFAVVEVPHSLFWSFSSSLSAFGNVGVPLFVMISGALLLNRTYDLKDFFKRRFSRILIPYIFWIAVAIIFRIYVTHDAATLDYVASRFFGKGYAWFVWMLMGLYLFTPVINSFIKEYDLKGVKYFLVIWLLTIILVTFNMYPFHQLELSYFAGFLGYFVLGYYLKTTSFRLSNRAMILIGALVFLISTAYAIHLNVSGEIVMWKNFYLTIFPVLQASGIFIFCRCFEEYSEMNIKSSANRIFTFVRDSIIGKALKSISRCSYGIYLTHYLIIWEILEIDRNVIPILGRNPFKWIPLIFLIVLLGSWALTWAFSRIPYLKEVSGA